MENGFGERGCGRHGPLERTRRLDGVDAQTEIVLLGDGPASDAGAGRDRIDYPRLIGIPAKPAKTLGMESGLLTDADQQTGAIVVF